MTPLPLALCIQPACLEHKYIRHRDASHIFERPERLRAVLLGFAAALARLEAAGRTADADDLSSMLSTLSLANAPYSSALLNVIPPPAPPVSPGAVLLHHPALQLAHSAPPEAPFPYLPASRGAALPSSTYLRDLHRWASDAVEAIRSTGCEIPDGLGLNPGDLYLGPGSIVAIEGAVQTVCQAVDGVCKERGTAEEPSTPSAEGPLPPFSKAFCAIRPPGHHCGEDAPSGFCYVNNVVVGAMHAYIQHDVDRAIIIDFDLHHGNGTQALVMPLNAAAYAEDLAQAAGKPPPPERGRSGGPRRGWKGFYGSVHDIYSYPCEDGDLDLIRDASVSLAGHGQHIHNVHLQPYADEADFYARVYPLYLSLLERARAFMHETEADPARTVLFVSAGFDACEHELPGMQRHGRRVPASFYARYTRDIAAFADAHTGGKVVSVLEGGYGDRALTSASMGHALGLMGTLGDGAWWSVGELERLERAVRKRRRGKLCALPADLAADPVLARTHAILAQFEGTTALPPPAPASAPPSASATPRMTLRERKSRAGYGESPLELRRRRAAPKDEPSPSKPKAEPEVPPEVPPGAYPSPPASEPAPEPEPSLLEPQRPTQATAETRPHVKAEPQGSMPGPEDAPGSDAARIMLRIPRVATPSAPVSAGGDATPSPSASPSPIPTHSLRSPMPPRPRPAEAPAPLLPPPPAPSVQPFPPGAVRPAAPPLVAPASFRASVLTAPDLPPTPARPDPPRPPVAGVGAGARPAPSVEDAPDSGR